MSFKDDYLQPRDKTTVPTGSFPAGGIVCKKTFESIRSLRYIRSEMQVTKHIKRGKQLS
jgi:hypothetical protein